MATVILLRHGQTAATASGVLSGRTPGVSLDETGFRQAANVGEWMRPIVIADVVSSPMDRCLQTARAATGREPHIDERLTECDYGDWTGKALTDLRAEPLWQVVQTRPSAMVFPGGEALRDVSHRAVSAIREHDRRVEAEHGEQARWVAVTHSDVIKCIAADALGMHLDLFQRIVIDTCSVTTISYSENGPFVVGLNRRNLAEREARVEE